jgi:hypothetical protein
LVFLPGEREIRDAAEALRKHHPPHVEILPLFARLSAQEQERVFKTSNARRIVLATNVAETSLTVPGIRYVVDAGLARVKRYRYRNKGEQLQSEPIAQSAANQRAGRCGRVAAGVCIRLYEEQDYALRPKFTEPEILRSSLAAVILRMKSLHLTDVDIGYFNSARRLNPPLRQGRDRAALRAGLVDGTLDALVSDHMPVTADEKNMPFAEATPGATGLELLLSLALRWAADEGQPLARALEVVTAAPVRVLGNALGSLAASAGRLVDGGVADICIFDPLAHWQVMPERLSSQGKHTPFAFKTSGFELPAQVRYTLVAGHIAFDAA